MIKICVVCEKNFECYDKPTKHGHGGTRNIKKRPSNTLTCSHKCSSIYVHRKK